MDEENNQNSGVDELEQTTQKAGQVAKGVANGAKNKASDVVQKAIDRKNGASKGDKKKKIVGPDSKAKGKMYSAKGAAKMAKGAAELGAGASAKVAGMAAKGPARALKGLGSALGRIPYAGPALKSALNTAAQTMYNAADRLNKFGNKAIEAGENDIKSGKHDTKRGKTLAETGEDIGDSKEDSKIGDIGAAPNSPAKPNPKAIIRNIKAKVFKKKAMIKILIIGGVALIGLLIIAVLLLGIEGQEGTYREGDSSNVPYVVTSQILSKIEILEDGNDGYTYGFKDEEGNQISLEEICSRTIDQLGANGSKVLDTLGKTKKQQVKTLKILVEAEVATQFPDLGGDGADKEWDKESLKGNIQVKRKLEDGSVKDLTYINPTEFGNMVSSNDENVMNYYTLQRASKSSSNVNASTSVLATWIKHFENQQMLKFLNGEVEYENAGVFVQDYITPDKQYYICGTDYGLNNHTLNYGFGIFIGYDYRYI